MGILWHALIARFKPHLSLMDLQRVTEDSFEICTKNSAGSEIYKALRDNNPAVDHPTRWREEFERSLQKIASKPTRKSQAAECRKIFLDVSEKCAFFSIIFQMGDSDLQGALIANLFYPELADESTSQYLQLGATQHFDCIIENTALMLLYRQQFNSTVAFDTFSTPYNLMCQMNAEILIKNMLTVLASSGISKVYQEAISRPLSQKLGQIMADFKVNLCLLSPSAPDTRPFQNFFQTYSTQLDEFKQATSVGQQA